MAGVELPQPGSGTRASIRRLTRGYGRYWPAIIQGKRASFIVSGSEAAGGELLTAKLVESPPRFSLPLGSTEMYVGALLSFAPWEDPAEEIVQVRASITATGADGSSGPAPEPFSTVHAYGAQIYVEYGSPQSHALPNTRYDTVLTSVSNQGIVRAVRLLPWACRS